MSANDMVKWMKFNLNSGKTEKGKQLLDKERIAEMHTVTTPINSKYNLFRPEFPVDDVTIGYGHAWRIGEYRGKYCSGNVTYCNYHHAKMSV